LPSMCSEGALSGGSSRCAADAACKPLQERPHRVQASYILNLTPFNLKRAFANCHLHCSHKKHLKGAKLALNILESRMHVAHLQC
jgi:hypothetical protein